ncbi:MAG: vanadium-dependent haloperoxidase [Singulisphaera sp.]
MHRSDVVLDWNETLLDAIRADRTPPPRAAKAMAIVQIAAYDAVNSIVQAHAPYAFFDPAPSWVSAEAAATAAAHRTLVSLYPDRAATFDAALAAALADIPDGEGEAAGVDLGRRSAETILERRRSDASDATLPYSGGLDPGQWRPTPASADALLPQWPFVTPFALTHPAQFRPAGPPPLTGAAYATDLDEVRRLGRVDSAERTPEQTLIARFWADGTGTATPPGHWNQIARDVSRQRDTGLYENARTFALLNIALADAGISSWDAKYFYGLWRPITAIREADLDGNPATAPDPGWSPLLATRRSRVTPRATAPSARGAAVLSSVFGPETAFATATDDVTGVARSFGSFAEAAAEAGRSRIYGGIHFEFDNRDGLAAGAAVGQYVTWTQLA